MKIPKWTKPAIVGAIFGAAATAVIGFTEAGWVSAGSAARLADQHAAAAVVAALAPVCVGQSKLDPLAGDKIKKMTTMITDYEKRDFVISAGWATISGSEVPSGDVATACAALLVKAAQG